MYNAGTAWFFLGELWKQMFKFPPMSDSTVFNSVAQWDIATNYLRELDYSGVPATTMMGAYCEVNHV